MAAALGALGARSRGAAVAAAAEDTVAKPKIADQAPSPWPDILRLELGAALIPFVNEPWKLADKIQALRPKLREELGITLPAVRIVDNLALDQHAYRIALRGAEVARGTIRTTLALAIPGPRGPARKSKDSRPASRPLASPRSGSPTNSPPRRALRVTPWSMRSPCS